MTPLELIQKLSSVLGANSWNGELCLNARSACVVWTESDGHVAVDPFLVRWYGAGTKARYCELIGTSSLGGASLTLSRDEFREALKQKFLLGDSDFCGSGTYYFVTEVNGDDK